MSIAIHVRDDNSCYCEYGEIPITYTDIKLGIWPD